MGLSLLEQSKFAAWLLPLLDAALDEQELSNLYELSALVLDWVGDNPENGIALDISEYAYEKWQVAKGMEDTGWGAHARQRVLVVLADTGVDGNLSSMNDRVH